MSSVQIFRTFAAAAALAAGSLMATAGHAEIINFDSEGFTGPCCAASTSASTINVSTSIGTVTFSGGAILTGESALPADTTSVYYTSYFLSGGVNPITVTFPSNISNFFLDVYNGETYSDSFTVSDNLGHSHTVNLAPNSSGGNALVSFPAAGNVVTIFTSDRSGFDFSIEDIGFNQPTPGVPEPGTWAVMLIGMAGLGMAMRRRTRTAPAAA